MKRTRHQLAPAMPGQKIIDRAVAGCVPNGPFVGRLEIVDVQHLAGPGGFGKTCQQDPFLGQGHVLALASTARLGFERLEPAAVIGHVRPVHRAQRHTHRFSNRRLRHPTFTQQHHLNALAPLRISVPAQRCLQPTDLAFGAFDHLFPPNQMVPANHTSRPENNSLRCSAPPNQKHLDSISYGSGIRRQSSTHLHGATRTDPGGRC